MGHPNPAVESKLRSCDVDGVIRRHGVGAAEPRKGERGEDVEQERQTPTRQKSTGSGTVMNRWRSREGASANREAGMVTVETAIALGASVIVVTALALAVSVAGLRGEVCQAAREAARSYSIGEAGGASVGRAAVSTSVSGGDPWFTASAAAPAFQVRSWQAPSVTCEVTAIREPLARWAGGSG